MRLSSFAEAQNTREKLRRLEKLHEEQSLISAENSYTHELSLRSIKKMIHQLKEEIAQFEGFQKELT